MNFKQRRVPGLLALASIALICAGCTSGTSKPEAAASTSAAASLSPREAAVKFAECMRTNGIAAFPDPDASGSLTIDAVANGTGIDTSSPAWSQALAACKSLQPSGFTGNKRNAAQQQAAIMFAQCVRDHGVPDFADPDPNGPLIDIQTGITPTITAALKTCNHFIADQLTK